MRQIRFKARAKKTKEWVEGYYATIHAPRYGDENELIGFDKFPAIFNDEPGHRDCGHWTDIYPQTLCQQTDMEDADGIKIWENDIHHEPLSTLRNLCKIEVIGNRYDEA